MRSVSASRGRWKPGMSASTSWESAPFAMPKMRLRVVCGLSDTMATLAPQRAFTSVDLPTFGRPATATKPLLTAVPDVSSEPGLWERPSSPSHSASVTGETRHVGDSTAPASSQLERVRQELRRRRDDDLTARPRVHDSVEPELDEPLPAAPTR